ncbi:class I SAM-dependent methyltransferase [Falsiroseomonas tokyonensis]|uniref:Methyltransferase domain-containing protein n=1 Tax=Falsiroseomonas tokyonensis TaxID=430521 RepID=A0ABV7BY80_9PROT|nr:class I SAM-dependent methyltransferase [Falsiroseomonas tokyonensis]MBU8540528.1 class I SAM-dependent methyltransferase [Falsiroseomonas tokyonensis]
MSEATSRMVVPPPGVMLDMSCRCCGGHRVELVIDLGDQPHCNRLVRPDLAPGVEPHYPLRVGFCRDCTMVQIDHTIPKESMFTDYPYVSGTTKTLPAHFLATSQRIAAAYDVKPGDLVVDIGSNDGTWLKQWAFSGARVLGVEAAGNVAKLAQEAGVPTWHRFFNAECCADIRKEYGPAKVITAAGVFFHLEELHSVVEGIASLLADDGVFVVQAIYLGGMVENTAFDQVYHEHLCYYTLKSLSALLEQHGLEVFSADLVDIHGGSIEAHVARKGVRPVQDSVRSMQAEETRKGFGEIETYRRFADNVLDLRTRLVALLQGYKDSGKSVWAYGAPAKGATLLNSFGIGPELVQKAVEKNPMKVGLAIPGVRIPIEAEEGARPDAYLVLAWNFINEFLVKEKAYLAGGGELIVPIPKVHAYGKESA